MSHADRFKDESEVIEAMCNQKIIRGDRAVATALKKAGKVVEFAPGTELIRQGDKDTDCYFLLAGHVSLKVKNALLPYGRGAGELVGEFSAINPEMPRSATVTATDEVVALRCSAKALKKACQGSPEVWRLLAIDLTRKVEQRNRLISVTNERPRIFMIAAESRIEIARELQLSLSKDYDVDLWSDEDLIPPGDYELETLHRMAQSADFAIVLAHPDDLLEARERMTNEQWATVRFELGYLMSELSHHRTLVMIPDDQSGTRPKLFKGVQPMTYTLPVKKVPLDVALARAVDAIRGFVSQRQVRSRVQEAST